MAYTLAFATAVLALNGADELFLNALWVWTSIASRFRAAPPAGGGTQRPVAIFVPLWNEYGVIEDMLAHNLGAIRYQNYDIFVGCYPNDPLTMEAVHKASERWPRVHRVVCPHEGPTSKGDCLNWIYQGMLLEERARGREYEMVVLHDAEDIIHPDELTAATEDERDDFVQVPVLPLATSPFKFAQSVYCDEFAVAHTRDLSVRFAFGGFLPSAGVGTAFSRRALEALAAADANRVFDPGCMTEDYDAGYRLHALGLRQRFVAPKAGPAGPVATREYFPATWRAALRQRARWATGIVYQGWEKNGWSWTQSYWLWRDRKGPLVGVAAQLSNLCFLYGVAGLALRGAPGWQGRGVAVALGLQAVHLAVRTGCVWRWYGPAMALTTWLRQIYADALNVCAALTATRRYAAAKWRGEPLVWLKTSHTYPSMAALAASQSGYGVCPAIIEPSPAAIRALPRAVRREWGVVPFAIHEGELQAACRDEAVPGAEAALSRYTSLRVRIHPVVSEEYEILEMLAEAEEVAAPER